MGERIIRDYFNGGLHGATDLRHTGYLDRGRAFSGDPIFFLFHISFFLAILTQFTEIDHSWTLGPIKINNSLEPNLPKVRLLRERLKFHIFFYVLVQKDDLMHLQFARQALSAVFVCMLFQSGLPAQASVPDEATTITLDQAVHFLSTDGSDVVADPGEYSVESAQEWLRLIPGTERRNAMLIEAQRETHDAKVEIPIVLSTPGTEPDETDIHVVQFLNPDGTSLVATGTYSGIQSRGFDDGARQTAARARAVAERARQVAAQKASAARAAALKAKQAAEEAAARVKSQVQQFTQLQKCELMVNAIKEVRLSAANLAWVREGQSKQDELARWRQSAEIKQQIRDKTTRFIGAHKWLMPELKRIHQ